MNAADFCALMERWAVVMADHRDWLIQLDSVVGDSDLGLTMSDGFRAAADAVNKAPAVDVGKTAYLAGKAMASAVPSTMGTLMASGLMNAGKTFKGVEQLRAAARPNWATKPSWTDCIPPSKHWTTPSTAV